MTISSNQPSLIIDRSDKDFNKRIQHCRSRGGGNPAPNNPVGMTPNIEANTILSAALPELFLSWIPASAGTTRHGRLDITQKLQSLFHLFTFPPFYLSTLSLFHPFTFPPFHLSTLPPFHSSTFPPFHLFTFPLFHPSTLKKE